MANEKWHRITLEDGRIVEVDNDALAYLAGHPDGEYAGVRLVKEPVQTETIKCLRCGEPLRMSGFNGRPIWEHLTPPGERHGPFPRTHCEMPNHECPKRGCKRHALPDIPQPDASLDQWFLKEMGIDGSEENL
jgi:hypothetical protein